MFLRPPSSISQSCILFQGHWVHIQIHSHHLTLHFFFPVGHLNASQLYAYPQSASSKGAPQLGEGWEGLRDLSVKVKHIVHWINTNPPPPFHRHHHHANTRGKWGRPLSHRAQRYLGDVFEVFRTPTRQGVGPFKVPLFLCCLLCP